MKQLKRKQTQACLPKPGHDPEVDMTVLARLNALKSMGIPDLKSEWVWLFDAPAPNNSGPYLRMRFGAPDAGVDLWRARQTGQTHAGIVGR